jgi:thioredoxin-like negative regulator of GroEL/cold shock CspA family protein
LIVKEMRPLAAKVEADHPIRLRFTIKDKPSTGLLDLLAHDFDYVHEGMSTVQGEAAQFYSGFDLDWYPILVGLDVRRNLTNKLIEDVILRPEEDRPSQVELYLIRAEAGAGKSVLLKRLAWEAANNVGALCLCSRGTIPLSLGAIRELNEATGERIFLFIDNAAGNLSLINDAIAFARSHRIRLTLITAERVNEWNVRCESLEEYLSDYYQLYYLSRIEIESLVNLLRKYNSLGPNLSGKTFDEQVKEFDEKAGRQLLVALHEVTHGQPFEEILLDEYNSIIPLEAQRLYLSVCVLNRMQVPVRAGLISRVHNIPFDEFRERLFRPLEHVVRVIKLPWGDFAYRARHSEIAQIVFDQVLTDPTERFNEYIRIVRALNRVYSVDYEALRGILRAKWVHELFPSYEDAKAIYDVAEEIHGDDAYFYQQRANYERIRPNGNLSLAQTLLDKARELNPADSTIVHTLAEVYRSRAELADKKLERARFRREARALLRSIDATAPAARYAAVTELKLSIDDLHDLLADESSSDRAIDEGVRDAERAFESARQRYPGDSYVLTTESEFAKLLEDHERSFEALKRARTSNPRDPFIASRLAAILVKRDDRKTALEYIKTALESNRGDKRLNFQYAELLRANNETSIEDLIYYYHRAFTKWDRNYESQFWYARFAFESSDREKYRESKEVFKHLREIPLPYNDRSRLRDALGGLRTPRQYSGVIARIEAIYGFVSIDGRGDWVFFHENDVIEDIWGYLTSGTRVIFNIGFSLGGPKALNLQLE